ncbi:BQ2448_3238 [Microbotryum intermedium]|uniref:BQ2448_3238 protein n=1 Tax=Microbotryum intermedium TaxID=269621 RepID=A0A238FCT9_9BASI|nr:BQ2448_3238 [Microbotryum intermedium]
MSTPSSIYDPPPSFSLVSPFLYRSSVPTTSHLPNLLPLHLSTILSLGPEIPPKALQQWCELQNVRLVHLGHKRDVLREAGTWKPVQEELVKDGLQFVMLKENAPCLVVDPSGVHEVGILIGCLRKLQRWTLSAIFAEYASLAGSKSRDIEEQFIELFDTDLVVIPPLTECIDGIRDVINYPAPPPRPSKGHPPPSIPPTRLE